MLEFLFLGRKDLAKEISRLESQVDDLSCARNKACKIIEWLNTSIRSAHHDIKIAENKVRSAEKERDAAVDYAAKAIVEYRINASAKEQSQ